MSLELLLFSAEFIWIHLIYLLAYSKALHYANGNSLQNLKFFARGYFFIYQVNHAFNANAPICSFLSFAGKHPRQLLPARVQLT